MICKKCNKSFSEDFRFCDVCGGPLESEPEQVTYESNAQPAQQPEQQPRQETWQPTPPPPVNPVMQQTTYNWGGGQPDQNVSFKEWIGIMLIPLIPCVGWLIYIVLMFVWAFGTSAKPSKKTWAQANLLIMLIGVVLLVVIMVIMMAAGYSMFDELDALRYY